MCARAGDCQCQQPGRYVCIYRPTIDFKCARDRVWDDTESIRAQWQGAQHSSCMHASYRGPRAGDQFPAGFDPTQKTYTPTAIIFGHFGWPAARGAHGGMKPLHRADKCGTRVAANAHTLAHFLVYFIGVNALAGFACLYACCIEVIHLHTSPCRTICNNVQNPFIPSHVLLNLSTCN